MKMMKQIKIKIKQDLFKTLLTSLINGEVNQEITQMKKKKSNELVIN
jgi:hypothetical protein